MMIWGYDRGVLGLYEIIDTLQYCVTNDEIARANIAWTRTEQPSYAMGAELMVNLLCHVDVNGTERPNREWSQISTTSRIDA